MYMLSSCMHSERATTYSGGSKVVYKSSLPRFCSTISQAHVFFIPINLTYKIKSKILLKKLLNLKEKKNFIPL